MCVCLCVWVADDDHEDTAADVLRKWKRAMRRPGKDNDDDDVGDRSYNSHSK